MLINTILLLPYPEALAIYPFGQVSWLAPTLWPSRKIQWHEAKRWRCLQLREQFRNCTEFPFHSLWTIAHSKTQSDGQDTNKKLCILKKVKKE